MTKEPVKLRKRPVKSGLTSLYLDIYINGKRRYEFLKLYLVPEKTRADRERNRQTLRFAETIRAKRILEVQSSRFGLSADKGETYLFEYAAKHFSGKRKHPAAGVIRAYEKRGKTTFNDIGPDWAKGLHAHIEGMKLKNSTRVEYWTKIKAMFAAATADGIMQKNPLDGIQGFRAEKARREFLTPDELKALALTPIYKEEKYSDIKRAFLFSCFTGVRYSDICALTYSNVRGKELVFRQRKTKEVLYTSLTEQALKVAGEGKPAAHLFRLPDERQLNRVIARWTAAAGITKHITFHCARHTFATILINRGVDLYTVSKLLGHTNIATTQVYAKIVDEKKREAVNLFPDIL